MMRHLNILKTSVLLFSIILLFAACKSKSDTEKRNIQLLTDSSAYINNLYSDTAVIVKPEGVNSGKNTPASKSNTVDHSASDNSGSISSSSSSNNNTGNSTSTTTDNQKKGWSKAAKGAVIGGAAGAVGGAVISKKGSGAAVGAAVGAASGYIIGRDQDKQDGRVKKKKH